MAFDKKPILALIFYFNFDLDIFKVLYKFVCYISLEFAEFFIKKYIQNYQTNYQTISKSFQLDYINLGKKKVI